MIEITRPATAFDVSNVIESWLSRFTADQRYRAPSTCAGLVAVHGLWSTDELRCIATHLNSIANGRDQIAAAHRGQTHRSLP